MQRPIGTPNITKGIALLDFNLRQSKTLALSATAELRLVSQRLPFFTEISLRADGEFDEKFVLIRLVFSQ